MRKREGSRNPSCHSAKRQCHALFYHPKEDSLALGAQGHANADLTRALPHPIGQYPVNPHRRQDQGEPGENVH